MTARLVLFIFFLSLIGFFLSLGGYRKYFNPEENLSFQHLQKEKQAYLERKKQESEPKVAEKEGEEESEEKIVIDMNDPVIKRGHEVYTATGECITCHGENGEGNVAEEAPLVAGQHNWYVVDQLKQMKSGQRSNEKMGPYLAKINEEDMEAVAKYIQLLRVKGQE